MRVEEDYVKLLKLFNKNSVRYCVVGAFAVGFHVRPRYTKDIDILVEPTAENAGRIIKSLNEFGFKSLKFNKKDFTKKNNVIQLGYEPVRIDIINSVGGSNFDAIWKGRVSGIYGGQKIFFIGMNELIKSKKATGRGQDKVDLELLLSAKKAKSRTIAEK